MIKRFLLTVLRGVILFSGLFAMAAFGAEIPVQGGIGGLPWRSDGTIQPVLTVNPREMDLGTLGPGEEVKRVLYLRNVGSGSVNWSTEGPEGWNKTESQKISGVVGERPEPFKIQLIFLNEKGTGKPQKCPLLLRLEGGGGYATFRKEVPVGAFRESIRFHFPGGTRTFFIQGRLSELVSASLLDVEPMRLDFGSVRPGEQVTRRVLVTNRGKEILKWKGGQAGAKGMPTAVTPPGRYVSFFNEAVVGTGTYLVSGQLRDNMELSGSWPEEGGYPLSRGEQIALRYRFVGTGISLFIWKMPEGGPLSVFIDEQFVEMIDGFSVRREWVELAIAQGQPDTSHLLTVVSGGGRVVLEGVRIFGKPLQKGPRGWISLFPDSGMTTRETDYVNVALNTRQLVPGIYGDHLLFVSNGGEADVEVFLEVATETQPRFLDVYRYVVDSDFLYTTNPQAEASRLQVKGYRNLGISFRLFNAGTPGTTDFFRWFNPRKGDHFYSHDPVGGGKPLSGYLFEGSIGNIATSRLAGTRELYRWYNPTTRCHFYTTDQGGEGLGKRGYRFDGIAGFVR